MWDRGDRWHAQKIQINKIIGENEKCVLFYEQTEQTFWPSQYLPHMILVKIKRVKYIKHLNFGT